MATTALDVKKALLAKVEGLSGVPADLQRTYGFPARNPEREWIMVGAVKWSRTQWVTNRSLEEDYSVDVNASVQILGGTAEDAEVTVLGYMASLQDALKSDPTLGNSHVVHLELAPMSLNSWPIENGYEAEYKAEVRVTARL